MSMPWESNVRGREMASVRVEGTKCGSNSERSVVISVTHLYYQMILSLSYLFIILFIFIIQHIYHHTSYYLYHIKYSLYHICYNLNMYSLYFIYHTKLVLSYLLYHTKQVLCHTYCIIQSKFCAIHKYFLIYIISLHLKNIIFSYFFLFNIS